MNDPTRPESTGSPAVRTRRVRRRSRPRPRARGPFGDPAPAPATARGTGRVTTRGSRPDRADPQAGVETKEHSVADLRAAARQAGVVLPDVDRPDVDPPDADPADDDADAPDVEVDLVEAERREAADEAGIERDPLADATGPATPRWIDPRIRERRVAVTRAEGRRRLRILLTAVCIASAIGIAWLVVQSPLLAVDTVNVRGTTQESQAAVRAAAGVHTGSALLFVDTGAVARRVEALPWVASAKVDRGLPERPHDHRRGARAVTSGARRRCRRARRAARSVPSCIVDRSGRVLSTAAAPPPGVPRAARGRACPGRGGAIEPAAPAAALAQLPDALRAQTASADPARRPGGPEARGRVRWRDPRGGGGAPRRSRGRRREGCRRARGARPARGRRPEGPLHRRAAFPARRRPDD